jgi:hypothetical protein
MASPELSRRVRKVVPYPPLSEMSDLQRREFHEALLDADSFEDLPGHGCHPASGVYLPSFAPRGASGTRARLRFPIAPVVLSPALKIGGVLGSPLPVAPPGAGSPSLAVFGLLRFRSRGRRPQD